MAAGRKRSGLADIAQEKKTSLTGMILFGLILVVSAVLWLLGIISFPIYLLIFIICLIGGLKNAKRWNQFGPSKNSYHKSS